MEVYRGFVVVFVFFLALFLSASEGYAYPNYCPGGTVSCVGCHGVPLCTKCPTDPTCVVGPTIWTVTASAGANGSISPSGGVSVTDGSNQQFTITPGADYQISNVLVDGSSVGPQTSYTFLNVNADHSISATFVLPAGPPPLADFSTTPRTATEPYIASFTDLSTDNPTSWLWDFGDGEKSIRQSPDHRYISPGIYTVTLTAANKN